MSAPCSSFDPCVRTPSAAELAHALDGRATGQNRWVACCPGHDDRHPSFHISEQDGKTLFHCFAGCPQDRVIATLVARGLWPDPERPHRERLHASGRPFIPQSAINHARIVLTLGYEDIRTGCSDRMWNGADRETFRAARKLMEEVRARAGHRAPAQDETQDETPVNDESESDLRCSG